MITLMKRSSHLNYKEIIMQLDGTGEYMRSIRSMMKDIVLEIQGFINFFATSEGRKEAYDKEMLNELMGIRNELKSVRLELSMIAEVIQIIGTPPNPEDDLN